MVQVNVKVNYEGKCYLTNVITAPTTPDEEIRQLAYKQVQKQWKNKA